MTAPHEPSFVTEDLPGIGGHIGEAPEDFQVDEVPAYEASGEGEHLYVRVQKRSLTTPDLVQALARAAEVEPRDIGYAGLKDKHAVTTQWLSLPGNARPPSEWELPDNVQLLSASRHNNKLRTGHLTANHFRITIVGVSGPSPAAAHEPAVGDGVLPLAQALGAAILERGLPNYFGAQRFGRGGENLARALHWLQSGGKARLSSFLLKLYPSVAQSEVFNRYLSARRKIDLKRLLNGEVVRLEGSGASFVVEDVEREAPRLAAGGIHLLGPLPGPKMRPALGEPLALEQSVLEELGLVGKAMDTLARFAPGARRDLLIKPQNWEVTAPAAGRVTLSFTLPAGSYATVLVREFTRSPLTLAASSDRES